jgi:ABC-2 type transport system ATP-binding protein
MSKSDQTPDIIFKGSGITKRYKSRAHSFTLQPLDLELHAGEITAVVGENGDGKTTLLSMVSGRLYLTGGRADYPYFEEHGIHSLYERQRKIAMLTQELPAWKGKLVDNLHFHAAVHDIKGAANEDWVRFILERLNLTAYQDATWKQISGGFRTRFSLAKALVQKPNLLVLDEPLANLDINTQLVFLNDLKDLVKSLEQPITMLISSQHLHEIENISDSIVFIRDGETLYNGSMAAFEADRQENAFELTCSLSKDELKSMLDDTGLISLKMAGDNFILRFPREIESEKVLKTLLDGGARITLFRDISQSTRKLFQVED